YETHPILTAPNIHRGVIPIFRQRISGPFNCSGAKGLRGVLRAAATNERTSSMGRIRKLLTVLSVALLLAGGTSSAFSAEKPKKEKEKEKEKKSERTAQPTPPTLEALEETIADLKAQVADLKSQVQKQQLQTEAAATASSVAAKPAASPAPATPAAIA